MTQDVLATHQPQNDIDERSTVTETDSSATEASEPERERPATRNTLKRNAPTGGAEQGDSKRKDTKKNKTQSVTERVTFEGPSANASSLAASAAAILSSVPNSATNSQTDQSTNQHVLTSQQQFAEVLSAATSIANQMNSPIAVPSLNSIVGSGGTGIHPNIEEMLSHPAAVAAAAAAQANVQAQAQQNSLDAAQTAGSKRQLRNMSNDERRQRRLLRNRVAAKECRRKKKAYVADLEEKVTRLEDENIRLHKELEELNAKLTLGALRIEENNRLIKEVEELNAKLAMRTVAQQVQGDNLDQTIKTDS